MGGFSGPTGGAKAGGKNPDLDFGGLTPGRVSNGNSTPTQPRLGKAPGGFFGGVSDWFGGLFGAQPKQNLLYRPAEMPTVTDTFGAQQPSLLDFKSRFSGARPPVSGARPQAAGALPTLESAQPAKGPLASLAAPARPQAAAGGLSAADRTALQAARIKQMRQPVQVPNPTGRPLTSSKGVFGGKLPGFGGSEAPAGAFQARLGRGQAPVKTIFGDPQASYKKVLLNKFRGAKGQQPVSIFDRLNYGRVATGRAAPAGQKRIAGNWLLKLAGNKPQEPLKPGKLDEAMARSGPSGPLPIGKLEEAMARGPKPKQPVELPPGVDPNSPNLRALGIEGVAAKPAVQPAKPVELTDSGQAKRSTGAGNNKTLRRLKGTTFFGGAGMEGAYLEDMQKALEEAGITNVRLADPKKWSKGHLLKDALSVPFENQRDDKQSDFSKFGEKGDQFNLVGYSYGGLQAAQGAIDYADKGGKVDNLVLMGTPIEKKFLDKLKNHPNIGSVKIIDLGQHGDPIKAGMSDWEIIKAAPSLGFQSGKGAVPTYEKQGHFYYSGSGTEGMKRRRKLAQELSKYGLK